MIVVAFTFSRMSSNTSLSHSLISSSDTQVQADTKYMFAFGALDKSSCIPHNQFVVAHFNNIS